MAIDLISVFSRESTLFLAISLHMWASRSLLWYWILCYSDVELRYISVRSHGLYNSFFSAFYSKQINNNDSNPSFHEEQLPAMENDLSFLITSFQTWSHEEQHGSKYPVVKILSSNKTNYCPCAPAFLGMILRKFRKIERCNNQPNSYAKRWKNTNGLIIHRRHYDNDVLHNFVRLLTYKHFITWKPLSLSDTIYHY